jgi:hypothetical protein
MALRTEMRTILQHVLDSVKGNDPAAWCVAAMSTLAHICLRNQVTRDEFTTMCQRAYDDADKTISPFKPN